ncbi:flagellar transcriptional regulator FlhD [Paraburkholderia youngii]|uniref:flagellar transcriptional regulator FlhD n=1 Tax=Paraburkholderia youngii TaxID=2782701 RepID=UPI003D1E3DA8
MSGNATQDFSDAIIESNLSYFILAQTMLRADKETAMFRLNLTMEIADILVGLSVQQQIELAKTGQLLTQFRFDDHKILSALTNRLGVAKRGTGATHAAVLLAAQEPVTIG